MTNSNNRQKQTSQKLGSNLNAGQSRRGFLQTSSILGASAAFVPYVFSSTSSAATVDLNGKKTIAAIGVGGSRGAYDRGTAIAKQAAKFGELIAVCDVDQVHNEEFNARFDRDLSMYTDYRKLFEEQQPDLVTIGTPDHWHIPIAVHALEAGCDVYCEKPLTLTIAEGAIIEDAVKRTGKVFQVGTQQRTEENQLFLYAIAIIQSGRLGDDVNAYIGIDSAPTGGPFKTTAIPEGLDWDMWLGPAPKADYSKQRRGDFRWFLDYSGGKMTDWGAHHIDIAQWALGLDQTGPTSVSGKGKFTDIVPDDFNWARYLDGEIMLPNAFNSATEFNIDLTFESGQNISVNNEYVNGSTKFGNGILFEGSKGRIFVNRGKLQGALIKEMFGMNIESTKVGRRRNSNHKEAIANLDPKLAEEFKAAFIKLHKGKENTSHMKNFFDCVEDRSEPISDVWSHINTMNSCHLCNLSLMVGRDLKWDPKARNFGDDSVANALLSRKQRDGFKTEMPAIESTETVGAG